MPPSMGAVRNILFIMCDQLRADHLGCYGHPHIATRNLDALARRGVRFERGFVEIDRHDGHAPEPSSAYAEWLRENGYASADPWSDFVISAIDAAGHVVSGWNMRNARLPARVAEPHSETAYTTDRALEFLRAQGERPWVLHLSYVKPHWPYLAPAPYHTRYTIEQCPPMKRHARELERAHPVLAAYRRQEECANFMHDEVWRTV